VRTLVWKGYGEHKNMRIMNKVDEVYDETRWCLCAVRHQLLSMGALLFATSRGAHLPFLAASEIALYNGYYYTSSAGYKE
jgi:hypothetical protein